MKTKIFNYFQIKKAAKLIQKGDLVAFPTETVYGLGANALDKNAVKKIFKVKKRPQDNPLIVHVSSINEVEKFAYLNDEAKILMKKFWPGPLTIILKKKKIIPSVVTSGKESVAIRFPSNKISQRLIKYSGVPIAAPSANISGKPSSTRFKHVLEDLDKKISGIIKSRRSKIGLESTIIDFTSKKPIILRPGGISFEKIRKIIPDTQIYLPKDRNTFKKNVEKKINFPGMKYKHYSPNAKIILFEKNSKNKIKLYKKKDFLKNKKIKIIDLNKKKNYSKKLFDIFRKCDKRGYDYILIGSMNEKEIGFAIMDRVRKASTKIIKD